MGRCTKNFYRSHADALVALAAIRDKHRGSDRKVPIRAYPCDVCDGWHLTAKRSTVRHRPPWETDPH